MIWEKVDALLERFDGHMEFEVASECCWSGELRLGLTNPENKPARSIVFFSVAGRDPADVAKRLLADAENWLATSGVEPLARIDWQDWPPATDGGQQ